jgi:hypothetical protein
VGQVPLLRQPQQASVARTVKPCDPNPMPKGPRGERRAADVIRNAVHVVRIATGEIEDTTQPANDKMRTGEEAPPRGIRERAPYCCVLRIAGAL